MYSTSNIYFWGFQFQKKFFLFVKGTVESPNRSNAGQVDKTTASPSPVPEGEEITNKDMEEQVS